MFILKNNPMKKILFASVLILMSVVFACSCTSSGNPPSGKDGSVSKPVQMDKKMFLTQVFDYEKNPNEWKFIGKRPCVIDFYADWCGPCRLVAPIMDDMAKEYEGKVDFYKINVDNEKELARMFGIQSIPAVLFIPSEGKPQMTQGALPKTTFVQIINDTFFKKVN